MTETLPDKRAHAFLSPSAASRWMVCKAAPWMEEQFGVDEPKPYAAEGTAAHAVAEKCAAALLAGGDIEKILSTVEGEELKGCMRCYLEAIADTFFEAPETWAVERKLNLSRVLGVPDQFGTADCVLVAGGVLHVFDYKHGVGVHVPVEHNKQLSIYALGCLQIPGAEGITDVVLHIVQPRLPSGPYVASWETSREELNKFGAELVLAASRASAIRDSSSADEDDFNPDDKTCRFCKAKSNCQAYSARASKALGLPKALPPPAMASDDELGALLTWKPLVEKFFKEAEGEAFNRLRLGLAIPGFKIVEGNQGIRRWRDKDEAYQMIVETMRIPQDYAFKRELISPTRAEELHKKVRREDGKPVIGERQWAKLQNLIVKNPGKPQLVEVSDKRPAICVDITDDMAEIADAQT